MIISLKKFPSVFFPVRDGVALETSCDPVQEFQYYVFEVTGCMKLSMGLRVFGDGAGNYQRRCSFLMLCFADMDLYSSFDNQYPYFLSGEFDSYQIGDDYVTRTVCTEYVHFSCRFAFVVDIDCYFVVDSNQSSKRNGGTQTLYLTIDCFTQGTDYSNYTLLVTSSANWTYQLITDVAPASKHSQGSVILMALTTHLCTHTHA